MGVVRRYNADDAVEGLLGQVRRDLSLDPAAPFTLITPKPGERCTRCCSRWRRKGMGLESCHVEQCLEHAAQDTHSITLFYILPCAIYLPMLLPSSSTLLATCSLGCIPTVCTATGLCTEPGPTQAQAGLPQHSQPAGPAQDARHPLSARLRAAAKRTPGAHEAPFAAIKWHKPIYCSKKSCAQCYESAAGCEDLLYMNCSTSLQCCHVQAPRLWLRRLLLIPPSPAVATALRNACAFLSGVAYPSPKP